jgi:hypothetical protein
VATSVPNFARGMLVPIGAGFKYLKNDPAVGGVLPAAWIIGAVCLVLAFVALWGMQDTFDRDLDYTETI